MGPDPRPAHRPSRPLAGVIAVALVLVAFAAGCAGDGDNPRPDRSTTSTAADPRRTTTTESDLPSAGLPPSQVLTSDLQFATFATVVARSGLTGRLDRLDALTLLAPDEAAMTALGPSLVRRLSTDRAAARAFVEQHAVADRVSLTDLLNRPGPLRTIAGGTVAVTFDPVAGEGDDGTPLRVGAARHSLVEVPTANGWVQVLRGVVVGTGEPDRG